MKYFYFILILFLVTSFFIFTNLNSGIIAKGRPADLTVIEPNKSWIVKGEIMQSLSPNTCFEKMPMQGTILSCWKNGRKIF